MPTRKPVLYALFALQTFCVVGLFPLSTSRAAEQPAAAAPTEPLPTAQRRMRAARDELQRAQGKVHDSDRRVRDSEEAVQDAQKRLETAKQDLERAKADLDAAKAREVAAKKEFDEVEAVIRRIYDTRK